MEKTFDQHMRQLDLIQSKLKQMKMTEIWQSVTNKQILILNISYSVFQNNY